MLFNLWILLSVQVCMCHYLSLPFLCPRCLLVGSLIPQPATEARPWQWKHRILSTRSPGNSLCLTEGRKDQRDLHQSINSFIYIGCGYRQSVIFLCVSQVFFTEQRGIKKQVNYEGRTNRLASDFSFDYYTLGENKAFLQDFKKYLFIIWFIRFCDCARSWLRGSNSQSQLSGS